MMLPEFVKKLSSRLRSNFLPLLPIFSKVLQDGLRLLLHFFHKGNHDHSSALYFLHESLKFIRIIREKNRYVHITCTLPSTCSIGLVDGFLYCHSGEFIKLSICSSKARTLPSCFVSTTSDPESGDSTVVLLLNFGGILQ